LRIIDESPNNEEEPEVGAEEVKDEEPPMTAKEVLDQIRRIKKFFISNDDAEGLDLALGIQSNVENKILNKRNSIK
jgi:hypothetical protein